MQNFNSKEDVFKSQLQTGLKIETRPQTNE